MIKWCSYCQKYIGEKAPFQTFEITHSICLNCKKSGRVKEANIRESVKPLQEFFECLQKRVLNSDFPTADELSESCRTLKVSPLDLVMGVLQPLLYWIGDLFSQGQITVYQEHKFSELTERLLLLVDSPKADILPPQCDILLLCVDTNYHYLGARVLESTFRAEGYKVLSLYPSLPNADVLQLIHKFSPTIVGLSVGLPSQLPVAKRLIDEIRCINAPKRIPLIALGGCGARECDSDKLPKVDFVDDPSNRQAFFEFVSAALNHSRLKAA